MGKMKRIIVVLGLIGVIGLAPAMTAVATDNGSGSYDPCEVAMGEKPAFCNDGPHTEPELYRTIGGILNTVYFWVGVIAIIVIIIGGITMMTSQGSPDKVKKARNAIIYALVGLVIALLAFAITTFILSALNGRITA